MLKTLYKETMDKHTPTQALIDSTKNAMYESLSASDSIERSAIIGICTRNDVAEKRCFSHKQLASCCALFAVVIGTAAICGFIATRNTSPKEDPLASSGHSVFEGDSPNSAGDSSVFVPSTNAQTTAVTTLFSQNFDTATVTSVSTTTATGAVSQATQATTTSVAQTQASATDAQTSTTTVQTSAITTTTSQTTTEKSDSPHRDFGYYDPQFDPQFKDDFKPIPEEEFLFEHDNMYYYFDCHKSDRVMLEIDGEEIPLRRAIDEKLINPQDLLGFEGFVCKAYYNNDRRSHPIDIHPNGEEMMQQSGGFMDFKHEGEKSETPSDYEENPPIE